MNYAVRMSQRNSSARAGMLSDRAVEQRGRRGTVGKVCPASINRHTGKPHEHNRAKARRLRQVVQ